MISETVRIGIQNEDPHSSPRVSTKHGSLTGESEYRVTCVCLNMICGLSYHIFNLLTTTN